MKLASLKEGQFVETGGYYTKGDAGQAKYLIVAAQAADGYGDHTLANGTVAVLQIGEGLVSIDTFGADPLDTIDSRAAIIAAATHTESINGTLVGSGVYKVSSTMSIPACNISGNITINVSGVTPVSYYISVGALPKQILGQALAVKGENTITLNTGSTSNVSAGDVIMLNNSQDNSFSGFRPNYREGEFSVVSEVVGANELRVDTELFASYAGFSNTKVATVTMATVDISGISVITDETVDNLVPLLQFVGLHKSKISKLRVDGNMYANIQFRSCFDCSIDSIFSRSVQTTLSGDDYAVRVLDSQQLNFSKLSLTSPRHAFTGSASGGADTVVNREIIVSNSYIKTTGEGQQPALDLHGNSEYCTFHNNEVFGGIEIRGNHNVVTNNRVTCSTLTNSPMIYMTELKGFEHNIHDNTLIFKGTPSDTVRGVILDCGGNSDELSALTTDGGTLSFNNNKANLAFDAGSTGVAIRIVNKGCTADTNIVMDGNELLATVSNNDLQIIIAHSSGTPFKSIIDNPTKITNIRRSYTGVNGGKLPSISISGGEIIGGLSTQVNIDYASDVTLTGGLYKEGVSGGIKVNVRDRVGKVLIDGVKVLDHLTTAQAGDTSSGIFVTLAETVMINTAIIGTANTSSYRYRVTNCDTFAVGNNFTFGTGADSYSSVTNPIVNL